MSTRKLSLLLATALVLLSGVSAQDVLVDGLEEETIQQDYQTDSIQFTTDTYLNKSITY